jgi:hypothetical protein
MRKPKNIGRIFNATTGRTTGNRFINHDDVALSNRRPQGEVLLEASPCLRKWLNTYGACGQVGHTFFTDAIPNQNTQAAYNRNAMRFFAWTKKKRLGMDNI